MPTPDLEALLAGRNKRSGLGLTSNEFSRARAMAENALTKLHPDDFRELYEQAKAKVAAEKNGAAK